MKNLRSMYQCSKYLRKEIENTKDSIKELEDYLSRLEEDINTELSEEDLKKENRARRRLYHWDIIMVLIIFGISAIILCLMFYFMS